MKKSLDKLTKANLSEKQRTDYHRILTQSLNKIADKTEKKAAIEASGLITNHNLMVIFISVSGDKFRQYNFSE